MTCLKYCIFWIGLIAVVNAQNNILIRIDKSFPKGETIDIHAYDKGKKKIVTSVKTAGIDSVVIPAFKNSGLYYISARGFNNYAEFIYNPEENIIIGVNGELPNGIVEIERSKENIAYSDLIKINFVYDKFLDSIRTTKRNLQFTLPDFYGRSFYLDSVYEVVATEKNGRLTYLQFNYPNTYTSKYLIQLGLVPVAQGADRLNFQSPDAYLAFNYFKYIISDTMLLKHYAVEDLIVKYLSNYGQPGFDGVKKSIDYTLRSFKGDTAVSRYIKSFLIRSFLDAKSPDMALYIMGDSGGGCEFDMEDKQAEYLSNYSHVQIGNTVDDIVLNDVNGNPVSLNNTTKKSSVSILLFWTSWCLHCQKFLPELKTLVDSYKGKVNVFAVSLDENKTEWMDFINSNSLKTWTHVAELKPIAKSTLAPRFMVTHTPTLFLLDKDRKILARNLTMDQLTTELNAIVK